MPRFIISLTVLFALLQGSLTQAQDNDLRNPTALVDNSPYTGDLEGMVERRIIRVLTVYGTRALLPRQWRKRYYCRVCESTRKSHQ
jgi:hypothetical protein